MPRERTHNKLLRVTFPSGKVICHKKASMTFIDALNEIGIEKLKTVNIELCHLPMFSPTIYPQYKDWMRLLEGGWYVNMQSDTEQKQLQLMAISNQLQLNLKVELGTDFIVSDKKQTQKTKQPKQRLLVKMPNGEYVAGENPIDTYIETVNLLDVEKILQRGVSVGDTPVIARYQVSPAYVQVGLNRWLFIPNGTKEKFKWLKTLSAFMRVPLEITLL